MSENASRRTLMKYAGASIGSTAIISDIHTARGNKVTTTKFAEVGIVFNGVPQRFSRIYSDRFAEYAGFSDRVELRDKISQSHSTHFVENSEVIKSDNFEEPGELYGDQRIVVPTKRGLNNDVAKSVQLTQSVRIPSVTVRFRNDTLLVSSGDQTAAVNSNRNRRIPLEEMTIPIREMSSITKTVIDTDGNRVEVETLPEPETVTVTPVVEMVNYGEVDVSRHSGGKQ